MPLSRRELLTLVLGASLGNWACKRVAPRSYPGKIVGGDKAFGHRLLDTAAAPQAMNAETTEVVIIGAGIAGLSAAWHLEREGMPRFVVLELETIAGGTSCYGTDGLVPHPWAAHYVPVPDMANRSLRRLLTEIGAFEPDTAGQLEPAESMLVRAPEERLFVGGRWVPGLVPTPLLDARDKQEHQRFQRQVDEWASYRDGQGRRAFTLPLDECSRSSPWIECDQMSAWDWLAREGYRSPRFLWWLEYGCRDDYGCTLRTTSAWALMLYHAARVPQKGEASAPFLTWPEGNGRIVRHVENVVGDRLLRNQLVCSVHPREHDVRLDVVRADGCRHAWLARHVILAVPRFIARHLLEPWRKQAPTWLTEFSYSPWFVANLHLADRPASRGFPLAWDNVLYDSPSLGYVVATHQALIDEGPTILTYYMPFTGEPAAARRRLSAGDHAGLCDAIMSDLVRVHPELPQLIERIDIWRWGHAMIRPTPGLIWGPGRPSARQTIGHLHFAHTDLSGVALFEEAHAHGVRAAQEVLDQIRSVPSVG
jgi:hypothetical protein